MALFIEMMVISSQNEIPTTHSREDNTSSTKNIITNDSIKAGLSNGWITIKSFVLQVISLPVIVKPSIWIESASKDIASKKFVISCFGISISVVTKPFVTGALKIVSIYYC